MSLQGSISCEVGVEQPSVDTLYHCNYIRRHHQEEGDDAERSQSVQTDEDRTRGSRGQERLEGVGGHHCKVKSGARCEN